MLGQLQRRCTKVSGLRISFTPSFQYSCSLILHLVQIPGQLNREGDYGGNSLI